MKILTNTNKTQMVIDRYSVFELRESASSLQKSLHSIASFMANDVLCSFHAGGIFTEPTYLTVQTGANKHITLQPEYLQYINHSCDPNIFFDTSAMQIISLKNIEPGDELTFFYPSTEWKMAQPFSCYCGSKNCLQKIQGAYYISDDILKQYRLTDFIQQELLQKNFNPSSL